MKDYLHWGIKEERVVFYFWSIDSVPGMLFSCLLLGTIAFLDEWLLRSSCKKEDQLERSYIADWLFSSLCCFRLSVSYFLMLVTMTFNLYLISALLNGYFFAHFLRLRAVARSAVYLPDNNSEGSTEILRESYATLAVPD